ncbi:MAG: CoA-disulfide reductase [Actinobacteria bacterium]|nr:CoA-disulfide reductase [Actinomycetota bacterium]
MNKFENKKRIIIIGGVAAGTSAATKARRKSETADIVIYEKYRYISYGTCGLPYFISDRITDIESLIINKVEHFEKRFNVKVNILHEVIRIDPDDKSILVRNLTTDEEFKDYYDKLIISTGSDPLVINPELYDATNTFSLKTIDDAVKLKDYINYLSEKDYSTLEIKDNSRDYSNNKNPVNAVIVGGGFIGLELLDSFLAKGFKVTIIEKLNQLLPVFDFEIVEYLENYLKDKGVSILKEDEIKDFEKDGRKYSIKNSSKKITAVNTLKGNKLPVDILFLSIGARPQVALAKEAGLAIGDSGAISVNEYMQTSNPDIYAAGDCCEVKDFITGINIKYNLANIASRQGRCVGYNAAGGKDKFTGGNPTSIIKVLDITIAKTGVSFREAKRLGYDAVKIELHYYDHAGYYPGANMIHIFLIYDKKSGRILGFEAVGKTGVDKKLDVLSAAIKCRLKVWDLANIDFGYHPEYGSAKDSINILGMIGENIKKGEVGFISAEELREKLSKKYNLILLDVRSRGEYKAEHIEGSFNIPIDVLRENLGSLNKDSEIIVYCHTSYRSYLALRILKNSGFKNVKNLNGSYLSWNRVLN